MGCKERNKKKNFFSSVFESVNLSWNFIFTIFILQLVCSVYSNSLEKFPFLYFLFLMLFLLLYLKCVLIPFRCKCFLLFSVYVCCFFFSQSFWFLVFCTSQKIFTSSFIYIQIRSFIYSNHFPNRNPSRRVNQEQTNKQTNIVAFTCHMERVVPAKTPYHSTSQHSNGLSYFPRDIGLLLLLLYLFSFFLNVYLALVFHMYSGATTIFGLIFKIVYFFFMHASCMFMSMCVYFYVNDMLLHDCALSLFKTYCWLLLLFFIFIFFFLFFFASWMQCMFRVLSVWERVKLKWKFVGVFS